MIDVRRFRIHESERGFQNAVIHVARLCRWHVVHFPDSRKVSEGGWPDLSLCREDGRILFAELKSERGKPSVSQMVIGYCLRRTARFIDMEKSLQYHIWRPSDWDEICEILQDGRTDI